MPKSDPQAIGKTLVSLLRPGISPKELFKQTRTAHPNATRKDIVRAAFSTMIDLADKDPKGARVLQGVGIDQRADAD